MQNSILNRFWSVLKIRGINVFELNCFEYFSFFALFENIALATFFLILTSCQSTSKLKIISLYQGCYIDFVASSYFYRKSVSLCILYKIHKTDLFIFDQGISSNNGTKPPPTTTSVYQ